MTSHEPSRRWNLLSSLFSLLGIALFAISIFVTSSASRWVPNAGFLCVFTGFAILLGRGVFDRRGEDRVAGTAGSVTRP